MSKRNLQATEPQSSDMQTTRRVALLPLKEAPLDHLEATTAATAPSPTLLVRIGDGPDGFPSALADLFRLQRCAETGRSRDCAAAIPAVRDLMIESPLAHRRPGLFLFREAAGFLASAMVHGRRRIADAAFTALRSVLEKGGGFAHRTAAEALGGLPHGIMPATDAAAGHAPAMPASWRELKKIGGAGGAGTPVWRGRSLVTAPDGQGRVLVCKWARRGESGRALAREVFWMSRLQFFAGDLPVRFDVPVPVCYRGRRLFRIRPGQRAAGAPPPDIDPSGTAVAFVANAAYFRYPNGPADHDRLPGSAFRRVMAQNAFLLGRLAAAGVLHTAPIPLFHNRVQVHRRRDRGRYEWYRAGRLDRWLASCTHPNFGPTGLRDFEHLAPLEEDGRSLYRCIGTHFLSLLLVLGSYFRGREPGRMGTDPNGTPVDARGLFDPQLMHDTIHDVFTMYCEGLTGHRPGFPLPVDVAQLVFRMIEEMGVDRHMTEILRKADQLQMSGAAFSRFLARRGIDTAGMTKAAGDIVLQTGPHLGAFNEPISLPELIRAVEAFSGLAVAARFREAADAFPTRHPRRVS